MKQLVESRFEIDTEGFKTQMSEISLWRLIQELISNSFDEKSVTTIQCNIEPGPTKNKITVKVIDDGDGFKDHKDIFTLYKESEKRTDPELRGRFNLGEKQFFAVAKTGSIKTGKYLIRFFDDKREINKETSTTRGVSIFATFETNDTPPDIISSLEDIAVPSNKKFILNGTLQQPKKIIKKFKAKLSTPFALKANQPLTLLKRECEIFLYEKLSGETPYIYELGVPVQKIQQSINWHIDVKQKIPQSITRNVISDKYLQNLYSEIARNSLDIIDDDNAGSNWISEALKKADEKTSKELLKKRYGTDLVAIESSNPISNEQALEEGFVLIKGSTLDNEVKNNLINKNETLVFASKKFPSGNAESTPVEPTKNMEWFARIVKKIAKDVTGNDIDVDFFDAPDASDIANYGTNTMGFNVALLGKDFFNTFSKKAVGIVIHELAHALDKDNDQCGQYSHLKMAFINNMETVAGIIGFRGIGYWLKQVN